MDYGHWICIFVRHETKTGVGDAVASLMLLMTIMAHGNIPLKTLIGLLALSGNLEFARRFAGFKEYHR
jgi:hypothetical protein